MEHIREFDSGEPNREPLFFLKPDTALLRNNDTFWLPEFSREVHYETELVFKINRTGRCVEERFAHRYYDEVTLGIDFTARDLQRRAIADGHPWTTAKAFDRLAAVAPVWLPVERNADGTLRNLHFEMALNDSVRQSGNSDDMIFSVDRIVAYVSQFMTLRMGDLIFTGTPAGVGPLATDDHISAWLNGQQLFDFDVK